MADNKDELKGINQKVGELIKAKRIQKELTLHNCQRLVVYQRLLLRT